MCCSTTSAGSGPPPMASAPAPCRRRVVWAQAQGRRIRSNRIYWAHLAVTAATGVREEERHMQPARPVATLRRLRRSHAATLVRLASGDASVTERSPTFRDQPLRDLQASQGVRARRPDRAAGEAQWRPASRPPTGWSPCSRLLEESLDCLPRLFARMPVSTSSSRQRERVISPKRWSCGRSLKWGSVFIDLVFR